MLLLVCLIVRWERQASAASMVRDKAEAEIQIVQELGQKRLIDTYAMPSCIVPESPDWIHLGM